MQDYFERSVDLHQRELAATFDEVTFWSARFGAFLFTHLPTLRPQLQILDLGCGTGFLTFELAQVYGTSCQVTGVDTWPEAIERAAFKQQVYRLPNVRFVEADAAQLPFEARTFDLIVSNLGINNFADLNTVLAECCRVARPHASLVLATNLAGHMGEFYAVFRDVLVDLQKPTCLERLRRNEEHRGTKEALTSALEAAGFRAVRSAEDAFHLRYLDGSTLFRHRLTQLGFLEGWRQVVDPEDEVEVFALLEARLNELAAAQGDLRMTIPMLYLEAEKSA